MTKKSKEDLMAEGRRLGLSDQANARFVREEAKRLAQEARDQAKLEKQMSKIRDKVALLFPRKVK